jgi:DNA-binding MarR family transcriptional regulator
MAHRAVQRRRKNRAKGGMEFPPARSSGYLVRDAHRAFQHVLEQRIAKFGVTRGQWYFLRVLWIEDGLTQRELSARVGMMEPTTAIALRSMEKSGLIRRVRSRDDKRRTHVWLTAEGRRMQNRLLPIARQIVQQAQKGIGRRELEIFRAAISQMTKNLDRHRR